MFTFSLNRETMNVTGLMKPCQRPSQKPAVPAASAGFGPGAQAARRLTATTTSAVVDTRRALALIAASRDVEAPKHATARERPDPCHASSTGPVSYTHLRAHETRHDLVCRLLL